MKKYIVILSIMFVAATSKAQQTIQLLFPINGSSLDIDYPVFSWSAYQQLGSSQNVIYEFKIVELLPNQNEAYAINNNVPFFQQEINSTTFQYPITAPEFASCTNYAWQISVYTTTDVVDEVTLQRQKIKIAESVIYKFMSNGCNTNNRIISGTPVPYYMVLKKSLDNFIYAITDDEVKIKYFEPYDNNSIQYTITKPDLTVVQSGALMVENGYNYLKIPVDGLIDDVIYLVEIKTPKKDIYKAKFKIF